MRGRARLLSLLLVPLALAACGSSSTSSSSAGGGGASSSSASSSGSASSSSSSSGGGAVAAAQQATTAAAQIPTKIATDLGTFSPKKNVYIYHVACSQALVGCANQTKALKAAAQALGYKFDFCDGGSTPDTIAKCFTNAINAKPDVIIPNGIGMTGAGDAFATAKAQNIPIVGLFTGDDPGATGVVTEVAGDACTKEGGVLADAVIADSAGQAHAAFIDTKDFNCNVQRLQGFKDEYSKCTTCAALKTLDFSISGLQSDLPRQTQAFLQANPDLNYVVGTFDAVANTAVDAVRQSGHSIKVAGFDADPANVQLVAKGDIQMWDITTGTSDPGWAAVDAAARVASGQSVPATISVSQVLITKDNSAQIGQAYVGPTGYQDAYKHDWGLA
jgi:ribose transport system substrate-binding protein